MVTKDKRAAVVPAHFADSTEHGPLLEDVPGIVAVDAHISRVDD